MARIKGGLNAKKRHNRTLKLAKGYRGARSKQYRVAKQSVMRALASSYAGRKQKKRQFRQLWIARINAAARMNGLTYSQLINGLKKAAVFASVTTNAITFRWKCWRSAEQPWNKRLIVSAFPSHNAKTLIKNEWPLLSTKI